MNSMHRENHEHHHHFNYAEMYERSKSMYNVPEIMEKIKIREGSHIAEPGCGPGFFTIPLAERVFPSGKVYAIDSNYEALSILKKHIRDRHELHGTIEVHHANMIHTSLGDHSVDCIFLANVFHDIEDKAAFAVEAKRILKKGGRIIDFDWSKSETGFGPPNEIRIDMDHAQEIFRNLDFRVERAFELGLDHYCIILRD